MEGQQRSNGGPQGKALRGRDIDFIPLNLEEKSCRQPEESPPASPLPPPIFLYPGARKQKPQVRSSPGNAHGAGVQQEHPRTSPSSSPSSSSQQGYPEPSSPGAGGLSPTSSLQLMMLMMNYGGAGSGGSSSSNADRVQKKSSEDFTELEKMRHDPKG